MGLPRPLQSKLEGCCGCSRETSKGQRATYQRACEPGQRAPSRAVSTSCGRTYRCARPFPSPPSSLQRLLTTQELPITAPPAGAPLPVMSYSAASQPLSQPLWGIRSLEDCSLHLFVLKLDSWFPSFLLSCFHLSPNSHSSLEVSPQGIFLDVPDSGGRKATSWQFSLHLIYTSVVLVM